MPRKRGKVDKKRRMYIIISVVFAALMLLPAWFRSAPGGNVISKADLEKYLYTPDPRNLTIILFLASPKVCPLCPEVANNVTQAVELLKTLELHQKLNVTVTFKEFVCSNFPTCNNKEAAVNFQVYRVSQVPLILLSYRGFLVPIDPVGMGPQRLASLIFQWYTVMRSAWKPPEVGKYLLYLYDKAHESPYLTTLEEQAKLNGVTLVKLGCEQYPSNCTNTTALSTMLVLGVRPQDLPLAIVYKDGRAVAAAKVDVLKGVDVILQALKN